MAWAMQIHHHHDRIDTLMERSRWERPPQVEDGQTARVHAPRATALLVRQATGIEAGPTPDPTA